MVTAPRAFQDSSSHAADPLDDDKLRIYHGRVELGVGPSPARASLLHPSLAVCGCGSACARSSDTFAHFSFHGRALLPMRSACAGVLEVRVVHALTSKIWQQTRSRHVFLYIHILRWKVGDVL